jgi:hypothetical protein
MTVPRYCVVLVLVLISFLCLSCGTTTYREIYPLLNDGKYDSEFPYRGCSEQLEKIAESVRMVSCIAYYKSYVFPYESKIQRSDIQSLYFREKATREVFLNRTASGTATIIYSGNRRIAMLTCAHVVDFEDTIITYYRGEDQHQTKFISSLAIKDRQVNYAAAVTGARNLEILSIDREKDLAVLGQRVEETLNPLDIHVFPYPFGNAKELEWGAFVYLFGYPSGYRILTKGIVSNPNRDRSGAFLTDAVFNKGFSGGIVLAVRDGVPNFELVGMVRLVPGRQETYLTPVREGETIDYEQNIPYKGDIFVGNRVDILYGVAPAISSETILEFLKDNKESLSAKGYFLSVQDLSSKPVKGQ